MVTKAKPTRNADYRHTQSIARQRQAAKIAAQDVSTENLIDLLPRDESPRLPDAAPVDMPRPSWRGREPAIVHRIKWVDADNTSTCTSCAVIPSTRCCCTCAR